MERAMQACTATGSDAAKGLARAELRVRKHTLRLRTAESVHASAARTLPRPVLAEEKGKEYENDGRIG